MDPFLPVNPRRRDGGRPSLSGAFRIDGDRFRFPARQSLGDAVPRDGTRLGIICRRRLRKAHPARINFSALCNRIRWLSLSPHRLRDRPTRNVADTESLPPEAEW